MTTTDIAILKYLITTDGPVPYKEISTKFAISDRTARYHIGKINQFLLRNHLSSLEIIKRKGVALTEKKKTQAALSIFEQFVDLDTYQYSVNECINFITLKLLVTEEPLSSAFFEKELNLSRPTFRKYLKDVIKFFDHQKLEVRQPKCGQYVAKGRLSKIEQVIYNLLLENLTINEITGYLREGNTLSRKGELLLFNTFDYCLVEEVIAKLDELEATDPISYTDYEYLSLFVHHYCRLDELQLHVASIAKSKKIVIPPQFTSKLIANVEAYFNVKLGKDNPAFERMLEEHMKNLNIRITNSHEIHNPIYESFMNDHRKFVNELRKIVVKTSSSAGLKISDQELSLIAIYFVSEIKRIEAERIRGPQILVVCPEGRIVSNVISNRMRELFYTEKIVVSPVRNISEALFSKYDLVITTVPLADNYQHHVITVTPELNTSDLKKIAEYLPWKLNKDQEDIKYFGAIMNAISKNCLVKDWSQLEFEIIDILTKKTCHRHAEVVEVNFTKESIQVVPSAKNWEDAVDKATEHLIRINAITQNYREKIKSNTREFGPYMMIAPRIFFAHAGPEDGCNFNAISLTKFEKGIKFLPDQEEPVDIILTLAFKNIETNQVLENTLSFSKDQQKIAELRLMNSTEELYRFLKINFLA
ncbi:BglG family transcription antiterminator [Enterococcus sp. UD-01]|jgi:mannitol operon transcriptional antiterminator|uniref:BglG family transcription antiterminator n=1 Tax=Enterococcus sp. UD-01 TaxID=3373911 RepID=UPI00384AF17E